MRFWRILRIYILTFWAVSSPILLAEPPLASSASRQNKVEYFAEFYSYEGNPGGPRGTHTFGRFVKTINGKPTEVVDISWLPDSRFVSRLDRMPLFTAVPGKNRTLEETFLIAENKTITNHGKFGITEELFNGAKERKQELESGKLPYKFLASANSDEGVNCIHALMGSAGDIPTGKKSGVKATEAVINHFLGQNLMTRLSPVEPDSKSIPRLSWASERTAKSIGTPSTTHEVKSSKPILLPRLQSIFNRKKR